MKITITQHERVCVLTLHRPAQLNALNTEMMEQLVTTMQQLEKKGEVGCFVITGSEKVFAAGADIKEMAQHSYASMYRDDYFSGWESFTAIRTPKIAAVSGYALGGGCELALMCDTIYATTTAQFGQPEIKLGVIPGIGATQRLTKRIGKAKAAEMILTGRIIDAIEAEQIGLIARVLSNNNFLEQVLAIATTIASYSPMATQLGIESMNRALEVGLHEGILFERRMFHSLFDTPDQKEGMQAFIEKRTPNFTTQKQCI